MKSKNKSDGLNENVRAQSSRNNAQRFQSRENNSDRFQSTRNNTEWFQSRANNRFTNEERRYNGFCVFWNRVGCSNGECCRFLHEESPACRFQDQCFRKSSCKFYHQESQSDVNRSFLDQGARRQTQFQPKEKRSKSEGGGGGPKSALKNHLILLGIIQQGYLGRRIVFLTW